MYNNLWLTWESWARSFDILARVRRFSRGSRSHTLNPISPMIGNRGIILIVLIYKYKLNVLQNSDFIIGKMCMCNCLNHRQLIFRSYNQEIKKYNLHTTQKNCSHSFVKEQSHLRTKERQTSSKAGLLFSIHWFICCLLSGV